MIRVAFRILPNVFIFTIAFVLVSCSKRAPTRVIVRFSDSVDNVQEKLPLIDYDSQKRVGELIDLRVFHNRIYGVYQFNDSIKISRRSRFSIEQYGLFGTISLFVRLSPEVDFLKSGDTINCFMEFDKPDNTLDSAALRSIFDTLRKYIPIKHTIPDTMESGQ